MKTICTFISIIIVTVATLSGCRDRSQPANNEAPSTKTQPDSYLPVVPDSLRNVEDRAAYAACHYWDAIDFSNTSLISDTAFIEQHFSNFLAILSMAPKHKAVEAVDTLMLRADRFRTMFHTVTEFAESYLDHPNSPMRNEELYILFLHSILKSQQLPDIEKIRYRHRLDEAMKNRPGTLSADFRYINRDGIPASLHQTLRKARTTLLIFYNPECMHCKQIMDMAASITLSPGTQIIAIDAENDRDAWTRDKDTLPVEWTVGFATTPILDNELYHLPGSPTLYILDSDGIVIMKDPAPDQAFRYMELSRQ